MELDDLYREVILDHNQNPRRRGHLVDATASQGLFNPTCGDRITVELKVEGGHIDDAAFDGHGCSISMASASMLMESVAGQSTEQARAIAQGFIDFITGKSDAPPPGDWKSLAGVRRFASRVKCATLAHNALVQALEPGTEG
ncbi:MAG: Fe-S cluster assembly sulfur transfer protein SufU [Clostridia bacterium]